MAKPDFQSLIVFEDENYVVINKPSGVSSLHERIGLGDSVIEVARKYHPDLSLCHRLDKDTSGALLLSKHAHAYAHAAIQFEKRTVEKTYHAVVEGQALFEKQEVSVPLSVTRSGRSKIDHKQGKPSNTVFQTLKSFNHFTLVECMPKSGRQHQIRIHLASLGFPIAGDSIYGGRSPFLSQIKRGYSQAKNKEEGPMIGRFALHAFALNLENLSGDRLEVQAPYPKDISVFLKLLNRWDD